MGSRPTSEELLIESTARRFPIAVALFLAFLAAAFPLEASQAQLNALAYLQVYAAEVLISAAALCAAWVSRRHVRGIATLWACAMALCIVSYYPMVEGDPTMAMIALVCLVAGAPLILPIGIGHQLALAVTAATGLFQLLFVSGLESSLPWPYLVMAFGAVLCLSLISARSSVRFRREAWQREEGLERAKEDLRHALDRAEEGVRMRSTLVANVSHEFRTPVNIIVGYADMILDDDTDEETARDLCRRLRKSALDLDRLIGELLDLSSLSGVSLALASAPIGVDELVEEVANAARQRVHGRPIRVLALACDPSFHSDPIRVRQILDNLVANAVRFTTEGEIVVAARAEVGGVAFEVRDTGCGIEPDDLERVLEPFEQARADPGHGGMGLGLAVVRQLTELLGGSLEIASVPGQGTTVSVHLPTLRRPPLWDPDGAGRSLAGWAEAGDGEVAFGRVVS